MDPTLFQETWLPTTRTDTVLSTVTDAINNTSESQQTVNAVHRCSAFHCWNRVRIRSSWGSVF